MQGLNRDARESGELMDFVRSDQLGLIAMIEPDPTSESSAMFLLLTRTFAGRALCEIAHPFRSPAISSILGQPRSTASSRSQMVSSAKDKKVVLLCDCESRTSSRRRHTTADSSSHGNSASNRCMYSAVDFVLASLTPP